MIRGNGRVADALRVAIRALEGTADEARFSPVAPFFMASPDRTRESIARVFSGGHIPERLADVVRNEVDALLIVFAVELRMWSRALRISSDAMLALWMDGLPKQGVDLRLSDEFWEGLRLLVSPRPDPDAVEVTISYAQARFSMTARPELLLMAELVEVAECLSLFTDEPRIDERDDEAGDLRRALRRGAQISRGTLERCVVRIPHLTRRQYRDALGGFFKRDFLPMAEVTLDRGAAAENRWWQLFVETLRAEDEPDQPRSIIDRLKRAASDQFVDFVTVNGLARRPVAPLSTSEALAEFLDGDRPGMVVLGAGGAGKSALLRRLAEQCAETNRTVLIYTLRNRRGVLRLWDLLGASLGAVASEKDLLLDVARAFARRDEELVVVLDGLNEIGDVARLRELLLSVFEAATALAGGHAPRAGMRLLLTSRPEGYFRACSGLGVAPPSEAFAAFSKGPGRAPQAYLEVQPLTSAEREALFGAYFADAREDGAEHEMTRAARRDRRFAALLSKPLMVALAADLHRRGVPTKTLRSSPDLVDLVVDHGFRGLTKPHAAGWCERVVERIFERRLLVADRDVVKFEDLWMTSPDDRGAIVDALTDLSDMGIILPFLDQPHGLVQFVHERIEENLLGRHLNALGEAAASGPGRRRRTGRSPSAWPSARARASSRRRSSIICGRPWRTSSRGTARARRRYARGGAGCAPGRRRTVGPERSIAFWRGP